MYILNWLLVVYLGFAMAVNVAAVVVDNKTPAWRFSHLVMAAVEALCFYFAVALLGASY